MGKLDQALQFLRANNLFTCGAKELLGSNIPHVLMVMNPAEMLEQGITQFGQLFVQVPSGLIVNRLLDATFGRLARPGQSQDLWHLGKSLALYCATGGGLLLMPRVRNVISMKRTGKTDFVGMVGLHQQAEDPAKVRAAIADNLHQIKRIGVLATGLTVGFATAGALASRHGLSIPAQLLKGLQKVAIPQGNYARLTDMGAMLSWAMPAYVGLWLGSRDKVEKQEVLIRAAGWGFAFTLIPRALERGLNRVLEGRQFGPLGSGKNVAYAAQLALSVGLYTLIPTFVALVTRRDRARQAGLIPGSGAVAESGLRKVPVVSLPQPIVSPVVVPVTLPSGLSADANILLASPAFQSVLSPAAPIPVPSVYPRRYSALAIPARPMVRLAI